MGNGRFEQGCLSNEELSIIDIAQSKISLSQEREVGRSREASQQDGLFKIDRSKGGSGSLGTLPKNAKSRNAEAKKLAFHNT